MIAAGWRQRCLLPFAWLACAASIAPAQTGAPSEDPSIQQAREAFAEGRFPWYDPQTDALAPLEFFDPPTWELWDLSAAATGVMWTALALLAAVLVVLVLLVVRNWSGRAAAAADTGAVVTLDAERVEALPFLARRVRGDLLAQARHHYEQGNYGEAIIYLFSHQLVQLDKFSVIHLAKGKTNRQYLRETARVTPLKTALERTMLAFEGVFFGRRKLDRAGFELCWNDLERFEQQLRSEA